MADNPFESPSAHPYDSPSQASYGGTGTFEIGRCLRDAWGATWDAFPLWLGVSIVGALVAIAATLTILGLFLVVPVLAWGSYLFALNMLDRRAAFGDLFAGFSRYGDSLVAMLLFGLASFVLGLPGSVLQWAGIAAGSQTMISVGQLLAFVWFFAVTIRFIFAPFYIVDQGLPVLDALKASWTASSGQWLSLVGLMFLMFAVMIAGLIALVIGVIPASVIAWLMIASAYRQIAGRTP
jgi:hypothetical protein